MGCVVGTASAAGIRITASLATLQERGSRFPTLEPTPRWWLHRPLSQDVVSRDHGMADGPHVQGGNSPAAGARRAILHRSGHRTCGRARDPADPATIAVGRRDCDGEPRGDGNVLELDAEGRRAETRTTKDARQRAAGVYRTAQHENACRGRRARCELTTTPHRRSTGTLSAARATSPGSGPVCPVPRPCSNRFRSSESGTNR